MDCYIYRLIRLGFSIPDERTKAEYRKFIAKMESM